MRTAVPAHAVPARGFRPTERRARWAKRAALAFSVALGAAAAFAIGEMALRLRLGGRLSTGGALRDYGRYYTYVPGVTDTLVNEAGVAVIRTMDGNGLRNAPGRLEGADVILAGDSFMAARYSPDSSTVAGRLQRAGYRIYNIGVGGFSNFQSLTLLETLLPRAHPKAIVLGLYLGNDFRDNYVMDRGKVSPFLLRLRSWVASSHLLSLVRERIWLGWIKGYERDPVAAFGLAEIATLRRPPPAWVGESVGLTAEALRGFRALAESRGARLLVLGIPSKAQVHRSFPEIDRYGTDGRMPAAAASASRAGYSFDAPDVLAAEACARAGTPYHSLLPLFREHRDSALYFAVDIHWSDKGQELAAAFLDSLLRAEP